MAEAGAEADQIARQAGAATGAAVWDQEQHGPQHQQQAKSGWAHTYIMC